jgi:uncharacterized protein with FMN-binding domain
VTPKQDDSGSSRSSRWVKSNLVTLGSAAVLAVYSAGYARTRTAAEQFADEPRGRRAPQRPTTEVATPSTVTPVDTQATAPVKVDSPTIAPAPVEKRVAAKTPSVVAKPETLSAPAVAADTAPKSAKTVDTAPPVASTTPAAPPPPPTAPTTTPPADSAAPKTADSAHVQLKDGVFSGWGTSRHGDIEAAVEIKNGKIVSAFIVQCLTRYSCSWISALPPQVVTRQSAEVDYVSGATQSSNAFYYAIVEALKQAK